MSQHSGSSDQLTLNIDARRGRKPKPITNVNTNSRRISFAFKVDPKISALIGQCSKDREMPAFKLPRVFKKQKESRKREARKESALLACNEE